MAYQLKISLDDSSKPPIWRKVLVPGTFTFHELHAVIQAVMGWENGHLYAFRPDGRRGEDIGIPFDDDFMGVETIDARKTPIRKYLIRDKQKVAYEYDFGDGWAHTVLVEKITEDKMTAPHCLGGKGACPPEDCGGIYGYYGLVEAVNDPKHPEHEDMREWLGLEKGELWDVHAFDASACQQEIIHYQQYI
ncbi:MAG: plasmid pRiA4b ORF-3 family protein [Cyclobacteriaceae bacterium]